MIVARVLVSPLLTHACGRAAHEEEEDEHATARHASGAGARARSTAGPTSVVVCFLLRVLLRRAHSRGVAWLVLLRTKEEEEKLRGSMFAGLL